jgi:hypothetical protein
MLAARGSLLLPAPASPLVAPAALHPRPAGYEEAPAELPVICLHLDYVRLLSCAACCLGRLQVAAPGRRLLRRALRPAAVAVVWAGASRVLPRWVRSFKFVVVFCLHRFAGFAGFLIQGV